MKTTSKDILQQAKLSGIIAKLLRAVSTRSEGVFIEHRNLIPDYVMRLVIKDQKKQPTKSVRYFKCINNRAKGKKRIYASVVDGDKTYYMFYVDPKIVNALSKKSEGINADLVDKIKNKWVVTDGSYQFKCLKQLIYHMLCIESHSGKDNKPPSGSHLYEWAFADTFLENLASGLPIICSDNFYSLSINNFSIERNVFNAVS